MSSFYCIKNLNTNASIKDIDGKKGIVTGYFSHFNNVDSDGDIIRPGAFIKTILENGPASAQPRIKHLFNHNPSQPLGKLTELKEDATGLYYESQIGTHSLGNDFVKMVESGLISEHSIGFKVIKEAKLKDGNNEMTELKLWEGSSLSAWGANELTPITGLKNNGKELIEDLVNRQKALEKFCRNSSASDETIELLLLECKQLTQIIFELSEKATKPGESTLPEKAIVNDIQTFIKQLKTA
jgi:HK97 family phage prohead protease